MSTVTQYETEDIAIAPVRETIATLTEEPERSPNTMHRRRPLPIVKDAPGIP